MSNILTSLFIIEGPDCTGKTTLAKHLSQEYQVVYNHVTGGKELHEGMMRYHMNVISNAYTNMKLGKQYVVMDRLWMSEFCYGRALQRDPNGYDFDRILMELEPLCPVYVMCKSEHAYNKQLVDNNHAPLPKNEFTCVQEEYDLLWNIFRPNSDVKAPLADYMRSRCKTSSFLQYDLEKDGPSMIRFAHSLMDFAMKRRIFD